MPVIGFLSARGASDSLAELAAFREGLDDVGYVEGRNVAVEYRWAKGKFDELPGLATELVSRHVAVLVTFGTTLGLVAKAATKTIPIVFFSGADPVEAGLVTSFSRPESNVTGVNVFSNVLNAKRLQLLRELVPSAEFASDFCYKRQAHQQEEVL